MFLSLDIGILTAQRSRIRPFLMEGRGSIPAAASSSPVLVAATQVLPNYNAYILAYGVTVRGVPAYDYTGSLVFSLFINGGPILDNNNQAEWTLERGSVAQPLPTLIQTQSGGILQFFARRAIVSAVAQTVDFMAIGWQVPADMEPCKNSLR